MKDEILEKARNINRVKSEEAEILKAKLCPTCGSALKYETMYGIHDRTVCSVNRNHFNSPFTVEQYIKVVLKQ